ncbi:MAG TPA: SprT family zinc-dependent metalloprotease [Verrucomicrobiae bacterium]|jgi:hypothetical protein|nr:SprT family zinc-dependent metalloprotease [Verrucomicrobiae bacterium]
MRANLTIGKCDVLQGRTMSLRIDYRRRPNARRYILRLNETGDGGCVTIPRGGCHAEAQSFVRRNLSWLEDRLNRQRERIRATGDDNTILLRGEPVSLDAAAQQLLSTTDLSTIMGNSAMLRARLKTKFWRLAKTELPARVSELALAHGLAIRRVSVRDQRSRWGSCSVKAVISLNWRLIQTPGFVRDYIIIHELMHLREMNHSSRFWKHVYTAFPQTDAAEAWLKTHASLLRG